MSSVPTPQPQRVSREVNGRLEPGLDDLLVRPDLAGVLAREAVVRLLAQCATVEGLLVAELRRPPAPEQVRAPRPGIVDSGDDPEYLSIRELAERIPYSEGTIRNLISKGQLRLGEHYVKPRGRVMFRWAAVRAWLDVARKQAG
jgi:hypothetical protein